MRKKNYKGRCEKISLSKCLGVCKTYDPIQMAYARLLQEDDSISEFWCNVVLDTEEYQERRDAASKLAKETHAFKNAV